MKPREDKGVPGEGATCRKQQRDFIERGLRARDEARRKHEYFDAQTVHAELRRMIVKASRKLRS